MTRRAFTLVEVVLALALVGLVAGITFAALRDLGARERQIADHASRVSQLSTLDTLVERALRGSVVRLDSDAGISLSDAELRLVHRGVAPLDESAIDRIDLTIRWDPATGEITATHTGDEPLTEVVVAGVAWFDVRVHDGSSWRASFDSGSAGSLPAALRVSVWFGEPPLSAIGGAAPPSNEDASDDLPDPLADPGGFDEADPLEDLPDLGADDLIPPTRAPDRTRVYAIPDGGRASGEVAP